MADAANTQPCDTRAPASLLHPREAGRRPDLGARRTTTNPAARPPAGCEPGPLRTRAATPDHREPGSPTRPRKHDTTRPTPSEVDVTHPAGIHRTRRTDRVAAVSPESTRGRGLNFPVLARRPAVISPRLATTPAARRTQRGCSRRSANRSSRDPKSVFRRGGASEPAPPQW